MAITDNLISWWSLDEESDGTGAVTRADSHGSNTLTDNNTVASAAGKVGNAASFVAANLDYLSIANNASLQTGDVDFSVAAWVRFATIPSLAGIYSRDNTTTNREMILYKAASHRFTFLVFDATNSVIGTVASSQVIVVNTWYFVVAWHDSSGGTINLQVNNGTPVSADTTGTPSAKSVLTTIGVFSNAAPTTVMDGLIDEVVFAKQVWTPAERTFLYNGGAGTSYAEAVAGVHFGGGSRRNRLFRP